MSTTQYSTENIVKKHLNAFLLNLGIDSILTDYDENAVFISPERTYRGKQAIRGFFENFIAALPANARENFTMHSSVVDEDVAYIVWSVPGQVPMGTDTFVVRDNKIVHQTFAMYSAA